MSLKQETLTLPPVPKNFPEDDHFYGFNRPVRFEGEIHNLEIVGELPKEISGTFYRVMPEPQFPSFIPKDPWFNGDGNISAFHLKDGHVDFKQRYVRTEKFVRESEARRALLGKYRNKYTDAVAFKVRSTANTNVVYWQGKLLALKEDSPPYALDPVTLETLGLWDFDGQLPSLTFTAHPKFDPFTREMVCFGYEAKGDGTPDVCFYTVGTDGKFRETVWLTAPVPGMIHDYAVTKNYVVFPIIPLLCDVERLKKGGEHWQWENDIPMYLGVLPRHGAKGSDVKWFRAPHGFAGHVANGFENASGKIELHMAYMPGNAFFWWPDAQGKSPLPHEVALTLRRWEIDPAATDLDLPPGDLIVDGNLEFPRIDDRFATLPHSYAFFNVMDPRQTDFAFVMQPTRAGGGTPPFNGLAMYEYKTGRYQQYFAGPRKFTQESVFIPRSASAPEGDGYVLALQSNFDSMESELVLLDTRAFETPQCIIKLPVRVRSGLHGNWVDDADVDGHPPAPV